MNPWVGIALAALLALILYSAANTLIKAKASKALMERAVPFAKEGTDYATTMLVLGDSTGVGVGAKVPEGSVAGRVAAHIGATYVENYAVSGAAVADLSEQIAKVKCDSYNLVLIQIGGNDILSANKPAVAAAKLSEVLRTLPNASKVIVLSAGNVGGATIFPFVIRPFHTHLTLKYHAAFTDAVKGTGATYVNLYEPPHKDLFLKHPTRYLSEDGLHPSSDGYGLWFEKVKEAL